MSGRNEVARGRRRQQIKDKYSLTSVPASEVASQSGLAPQRLTLNNHFGWNLVNMAKVGDGAYPHLTQFYEKPDVSGREFEKVTYVLYLQQGDKETALKQTQTQGESLDFLGPKLKDHTGRGVREDKKRPDHSKDRKRKLIHEFFYKDRSRSPKRDKSKSPAPAVVVGEGETDLEYELKKVSPNVSNAQMWVVKEKQVKIREFDEEKDLIIKDIEKEKEEYVKKAKSATSKEHKKGQKKWTLRAGASSIVEKTSSKLIDSLKHESLKNGTGQLFDSPSRTNKFLYVSKDRSRGRQSRAQGDRSFY